MSLKAGIVGLPNVGKSTLFNAITKKSILVANYPFATIDPNVGIVTVPDERLKKLEEILDNYQVDTIIIGIPINMDGTEGFRVEVTKKFIHKLKCKFNKIKIEEIDERLTTVAAHKTMNYLGIKKENKKNIVDTISAVYILETYMNKPK